MNGIIIDGKVYEAVKWHDTNPCDSCAFDKEAKTCKYACSFCEWWQCIFRYSPTLTDKLNEK